MFFVVVYIIAVLTKTKKFDIEKIEGEFLVLNQEKWNARPTIPSSENTLLGTLSFPEDRYNEEGTSLRLLRGGRLIRRHEAWVIKGVIPTSLRYWSFGAYKLSDGPLDTFTPIESTLNSDMLIEAEEGDDIVCIMSPNYKFAEYVANQIKQKEYSDLKPTKKRVVFKYFQIPDYAPNEYYSLIFEGFSHIDQSLPLFKVESYKYTRGDEHDQYKFYPVQASDAKLLINKQTIDEYELIPCVRSMIKKLERNIGKYKRKNISEESTIEHEDCLYTDSGPIELNDYEKVVVAAVDHSSNGKCVYCEIIFVDDETNKVYDSKIVGKYEPTSVEDTIKIKLVSSKPHSGRIRILEKICIDRSTHLRPDFSTIIPPVTYVVSR
jgi:hypothetical protein